MKHFIITSVILFLSIYSWPTKMLITPDGKYLKISYRADWQEYVKNYVDMQL